MLINEPYIDKNPASGSRMLGGVRCGAKARASTEPATGAPKAVPTRVAPQLRLAH